MQRPKGTKDIYGLEQILKQQLEDHLRLIAELYNYQKIETPIFEQVEVFKRTVGLSSDIVTKELYEFSDKSNRLMALRPEGTAGIVRAFIQNNLNNDARFLKLYYLGQMFRYENPQQGRQRQFNQFGIENFSPKSPYVDAEIIFMAHQILKDLNIRAKLIINSLGNEQTRVNYREAFIKYLSPFVNELSSDSLKRLHTNPLRIFDDKVDSKKDFIKKAPRINEFYTNETSDYFTKVTELLQIFGVDYEINHDLVRGLDYYTDTIFEFVPLDAKGSQSTLIAGGRFDHLMTQMGGPNISGSGFALGVERIINELMTQNQQVSLSRGFVVYIMNLSEKTTTTVLNLALMLRSEGFITEWNVKPQKLLKLYTKSNIYNPNVIIIVGEQELATNHVNIKIAGHQENVAFANIVKYLKTNLSKFRSKNENN